MIIERAPAKVNLFLHVGPVKPNGRHDLCSLVVFAGDEASDRVCVSAGRDVSLKMTGGAAAAISAGSDNLVLKAAHALRQAAGISAGAAIELEKHLPVAGGIGGGSADAGATLRALTRLWKLDPRLAESVAPDLGGDVPVALLSRTALMRGEGERVDPLHLRRPLDAVLVNPNVACPTGPVFAAFDAAAKPGQLDALVDPGAVLEREDLPSLLAATRNDLEWPACELQPVVRSVLLELEQAPDVRFVRMSGSGATCFALFDSRDTARAAAARVSANHPTWWVRATQLGERT